MNLVKKRVSFGRIQFLRVLGVGIRPLDPRIVLNRVLALVLFVLEKDIQEIATFSHVATIFLSFRLFLVLAVFDLLQRVHVLLWGVVARHAEGLLLAGADLEDLFD